VKALGSEGRIGAVTAIGAVSPPGGDISEPVSQATLRIVNVFWGLSASLAYKRHFPAIDWLTTYSMYVDRLAGWFDANISPEWMELRQKTMQLLQEEAELEEIVRLVGVDALSLKDRLKLETARSIREDYLHQNAFHEVDTYTSMQKQFGLLHLILKWGELGQKALDMGAEFSKISALSVREDIGRAKYVEEKDVAERFAEINKKLEQEMGGLYEEGGIDIA